MSDRQVSQISGTGLYTAVLGDILDRMGFVNQFLPADVRPLGGRMLVGRAMPVQLATATRTRGGGFEKLTEALDQLEPGEVYLASGGTVPCAAWGELMTTTARGRGAAGAVINSYHRDTARLLTHDWPIFSRGAYAQDASVRSVVIDYRATIDVEGVEVRPGDLVVGDLDGVLIDPERHRGGSHRERRREDAGRGCRSGIHPGWNERRSSVCEVRSPLSARRPSGIRFQALMEESAGMSIAADQSRPLVVMLGEIMLRLKSPGHERLFQSPLLEATFAGGEANVAVSVANYGLPARYVTALPPGPLGDAAVRALRAMDVETDHVIRRPGRLGIYFVEAGATQRASSVVYDRDGAAIALAEPDEFDWSAILEGARWFHIRGITPALSESGGGTDRGQSARSQGAPAPRPRSTSTTGPSCGATAGPRPRSCVG